jgi:hypothetical protein
MEIVEEKKKIGEVVYMSLCIYISLSFRMTDFRYLSSFRFLISKHLLVSSTKAIYYLRCLFFFFFSFVWTTTRKARLRPPAMISVGLYSVCAPCPMVLNHCLSPSLMRPQNTTAHRSRSPTHLWNRRG